MNVTQADRLRGRGLHAQGQPLPKDLKYHNSTHHGNQDDTNDSSSEYSGPVLISFTSLDPSYKAKIRSCGKGGKTGKDVPNELKECNDCVEYFFTSEELMNHNRKHHPESPSSAEYPHMGKPLFKNGAQELSYSDSLEKFSQASSPVVSVARRSRGRPKGSASSSKKRHSVESNDLKKMTVDIKRRPRRSAAMKKHYYDKCPYCDKLFINLEHHILNKHEHNEDLTCSVAKTEVTTMPNNELIKWKIV